MRRSVLACVLAGLAVSACPGLGPAPAAAQPGPDPAARSEPAGRSKARQDALPDIEDEVLGTCATPRQAFLQLLYWLQKGTRWEPKRAALCVDASQLPNPGRDAPELARMLKETLDTRGVRIEVDELPTNPSYRDNQTGQHVYLDPPVQAEFGSAIFLRRDRDTKRWLFSAETLAAVPDLYPVTGGLDRYLPGWMSRRIAGVELWKLLALAVLYLVARLVKLVLLFVLGRYVRRLVQRSELEFIDHILDRARQPIGLLIAALVFKLAVPLLLLPIRASELARILIMGVATFAGVWLSYRLIDVFTHFMMARAERTDTKLDDQLVPLVSKTLKVFVSVVGGTFILQNLDVNVGSLLAGLGLGGLAFALAAKDTIANFFGSVMIFVDKPFQIGDWVVIGSTEGIIEEVGFRTSRVRTFYNSLVTVPNALITNTTIDNYGARQYRRYVANLGLCYDTPPDKVEAFCEGVRAIIAGMPDMRKDLYLVEFKEFGDSALVIMVYCFMATPTWNDELRVRTHLNLEIMRLAESLGVSFAYPTQTLHVASLPKQGDAWPSHSGPTEHDDLRRVIESFAHGGSAARPEGVQISEGYDCRDQPPERHDDQTLRKEGTPERPDKDSR